MRKDPSRLSKSHRSKPKKESTDTQVSVHITGARFTDPL
jgi:hypothetical protein